MGLSVLRGSGFPGAERGHGCLGSPGCWGLRKALGVSFPFQLHWAEPKSVHLTEGGQVGMDVSAAASCVRAPFSLTLTLEPFFLSLIEKAV